MLTGTPPARFCDDTKTIGFSVLVMYERLSGDMWLYTYEIGAPLSFAPLQKPRLNDCS